MNDDTIKADLLCIADSNWVLGHWYTNCMLNGRELTDFTSMAGIAEEKLGHVRALFGFMEDYFGYPEYQLEFGRDVENIHSMALLDSPPQSWADFVLTLYLADTAIWRFTDSMRNGEFKPVRNLLTKFGEEVYFHQMCIDGWLNAFDDVERTQLKEALSRRLPLALIWFDDGDSRSAFLESVLNKLAPFIDGQDDDFRKLAKTPERNNWDDLRRRPDGSAMPARLWESIVPTSDEALLARRPLAVSVTDNIDLFTKAKKDETEPQF